MTTEPVDAQVVDDGAGTALVERPAAGLFRTDDPAEVVVAASKVAGTLRDVLRRQRMVSTIGGREHVLVEGWTTLGSMLGVVPVVVWTRRLADPDGYEARVEARTLDGRVVGAAEAMCSRAERTWKARDDYALRSMAQTRATSKALRGPLGFVVSLAGFEATPGEEMPADRVDRSPYTRPATGEQKNAMVGALERLLGDRPASIQAATVLAESAGMMPALVADWVAMLPDWVAGNAATGEDKGAQESYRVPTRAV